MTTFEEMLSKQGPVFSDAGRQSMVGEQESDPRVSFGTLMEQQGSVFSGSLQPGRLSMVEGQDTGSVVKTEIESGVKPETEVGSGGGKPWVPTVGFMGFVKYGEKKDDFKYRFQINYSPDTQEQIVINVKQVKQLGKEVVRTNPEAHGNGLGEYLKNIKNNLKPGQLEINKIHILYYLRSVLGYFYVNDNVQAFKDLLTQAISSQGGGKRKRTKKRKTKKRKTKKRTKKRKNKKRTKRN